jgi:hypothetical protein
MNVNWQLLATLTAPVIAWTLGRVSGRGSKLVTYYGHVGAFQMQREPPNVPMNVHTHDVVIRNVGHKPATNVRVTHRFLPDYNILPPVPHTVVDVPGGGRDIIIERMVPGEQVTLAYLYFPPVTFMEVTTGVKSDDGFAQVVPVLLGRQYPRAVRFGATALMGVGVIAILYMLASAAQSLLSSAMK